MPSSAQIRKIPSHRLYKLDLINDNPHPDQATFLPYRVLLKATLTDEAKALGVRFDKIQEDNVFDLSAGMGNDNGQYSWGGIQFQRCARNICLEELESKQRFLRADLCGMDGRWNEKMPFNLDKNLGLVDYFHPLKNETYFKLGLKPEPIKERSLVLCFDGTSNHFSDQNTNVVKLVDLLKKDDPERQMVYYQTGVGTYVSPGLANSISEGVAKYLDKGLAWYLYQHVVDGYKYLVETYRAGDRICIFGFSRGAFTARALAGMVHCVGLLPRHNIEHIPFAYQLYANDKTRKDTDEVPKLFGALETDNANTPKPNPPLPNPSPLNPEDYKRTFCIPVQIDFVGVWDTVASVGALLPKFLPWIEYNPSIRAFRHALSLDERRASFVPSLWNHSFTNLEKQDVREVWFKGQHTDVGGGADKPTTADDPKHPYSRLSNIPLRWMVRQCLEADTIAVFDHNTMQQYRDSNNRVLENIEEREKELRVDELRQKNDAENKLILEFKKQSKTERELAERKIEKDKALEEDHAAEKEKARVTVEKLKVASLVESAKLDRIDIQHQPFDAMKKHRIWHLLEYLPLKRRVPKKEGYDETNALHRHQPRILIYERRKNPPRQDKSGRDLPQAQINSSTYPVRIHASLVDFLNHTAGSYVPRATWLERPEGEKPEVEDATDEYGLWTEEAFKVMFPASSKTPGVLDGVYSWWWGTKDHTE
ncbi:hypothetical protein BDV93DRAFT_548796 [Ceratobasidium sp. AG-I]|nr:hypothetical protein BDV93DRAFT_548796 [Ceratobasidium sp. AG-I]